MRNSNCQNIRREIEEVGSTALLGAAAISHIQACPACDTLSRQQTKLQEIISGLGTVEAPGDFEFRLRARLAEAKRGGARVSRLPDYSLGWRPVAAAAVLFLIVSSIAFVNLRTRTATPAVSKVETPEVTAPGSNADQILTPSTAGVGGERLASATDGSKTLATGPRTSERVPGSRGARTELASFPVNRFATRDSDSRMAPPSLRRENRLAESYPTAAFPINASYQSLKVSVDDARGASRTISLPTVSFGSERTISQNQSPLIASARGSW